ncbi:hypothetical protein H0241_28835 [Mesorhizobium sp. CCANP35]|uniref:SD-repeat containing protein B domain-containing protein n=1 Tax=Mesorhizobium neociceri TaxID=1307853 RepID=A0A838BC15_9HYPH|nr:hypothetical protein [Mesorhizobium neociceri]
MATLGTIVAVGLAVVVALATFAWRRARKRRKAQRRQNPANDYVVRQDWSVSHDSLNHSSFVYFDIDRDGRYGLGDRPMGGVMVRLHDANGHFASQARTNRSGFANFTVSTKHGKAPIHLPGTYRFTVSVPPGWRASSSNEIQSQHFQPLPGSPAGMVSEAMLQPVGLFPIRRLGGHATAPATISVEKKGRILAVHPVGDGEDFSLDLADDADAIVVDGRGFARRLALSAYPTALGLLSSKIPGIADDAPLQTIGFDDVTARDFRKLPSGYAGFNWFNVNAISRDYVKDGEGYVNGNVSGDHVCYTSSGHPAEFSSERPFGFHSVLLAAAWLKSEGEVARIESWLGDQLIASDAITLSALTPVHYAPMLGQVTRVRFSTRRYWQLVLDDLIVAR